MRGCQGSLFGVVMEDTQEMVDPIISTLVKQKQCGQRVDAGEAASSII